MVSDAYVRLTCDNCGTEEEIQLTALASGGWDERNVEGAIERLSWKEISDNVHHCETCAEGEQP